MKLKIPNWLVDRIVARAKRTPYFHLPGYMERYWLFQTRWLSCRVHVILRSDNERDLHDHPWNYWTVILRGGYVEVTPNPFRLRNEAWNPIYQRSEWIGPGRVLSRRATDQHRLELPAVRTALTLFFTGPKLRSWGFHTAAGFVPWREYAASAEHAAECDSHWGAGVR